MDNASLFGDEDRENSALCVPITSVNGTRSLYRDPQHAGERRESGIGDGQVRPAALNATDIAGYAMGLACLQTGRHGICQKITC